MNSTQQIEQPTPQAAEALTLVIQRVLSAPVERVFDAWTRPELVRRWFAPGPLSVSAADLDPRAGGKYRIVMTNPEGETHSPEGVYEEVVDNRKLVFTWKWQDSDLVTRVTVELQALDANRTELTLTHEGFPDDATMAPHAEGWNGCLDKLPNALASG